MDRLTYSLSIIFKNFFKKVCTKLLLYDIISTDQIIGGDYGKYKKDSKS